ncbi:MAG: hypothetical protein SGARI_001324, partial [Bacillariaceae sp.]
MFEHLCTQWFSTMKNLKELHCWIRVEPKALEECAPISHACINALANLTDLRKMDLYTDNNPDEILNPQILTL